ncbi:MAG TPA: ribonuclease P protein component [Bryobacteraceae bacterium]
MSARFVTQTPTNPIESSKRVLSFPKSVRILRSVDFRKVYDNGFRFSTPYFAAFCLHREDAGGPRIGFTLPRAIGKAVVRNRLKRRLREAIRPRLSLLAPSWDIVINPRRSGLAAPFQALVAELERLFARCKS